MRLQLVELGAADTATPESGAGAALAGVPPVAPATPPDSHAGAAAGRGGADAHAAFSRCLEAPEGVVPPYRDSKLTLLCRDALGGSIAPGSAARLTVRAAVTADP